ncbi:uncharacterized protein LOC133649665 [Entelurus aequoreus]|uniref:uncharacterized protein LOC133649665 n=1 Tax=Entelurus aequoreus TaxID=161455 RepID=UPI002B1D5425|nr:uncharacterized protein LOC133649665 [Entelurus aequoreus]
MACGIHLGLLVICLVQAEHARCLWAQEAQRQSDNAYVGYLQQGLARGNPQNQFRQASSVLASAQSDSGVASKVKVTVQSEHDGYSSVKVLRRRPGLSQQSALKPKKSPGLDLSTSIASSGTLNKHKSQQTKGNRKSSGSRRVGLPNKKAASAPSLAAKQQKPHRQVPRKQQNKARLFVAGYGAREYVPDMQTSATGAGSNTDLKPSHAGTSHQSKGFHGYGWVPKHSHAHPGNRRNPQHGSSEKVDSGKKFAPTDVLRIPKRFGGHAIRRMKAPKPQVFDEETQKASLQKKLFYRLPSRN